MYKIFFIIVVITLSGCSARHRESNQLAELLYKQSPQVVLQQLQEITPVNRDIVQHQLDVGYLQLITGDFQGAITTLLAAKTTMAELDATSVSENIGAGTINESLRRYSGYPTDRVMIHNILALSYLFNNEIYEARVEMLQSELAMQKLAEETQTNGQIASAHLLAGIIYELLGELSNALISYQDSLEVVRDNNIRVSLGLKQALLRVSLELGAEAKFRSYQQQFPTLPMPTKKTKSQLFVLYFDGVVSHKVENSILVPSHNFDQFIRISMPAYPNTNQSIRHIGIINNQSQIKSELVDDVDSLARADLEKEYPSILLLTTTRAISKYQLVKEAQNKDPLLGALFSFASILTEDADLRSWNMLPSTIQFAYLESYSDDVFVERGNGPIQQITVSENSKNILLINSLSSEIFHYQQR